MAVVEVETLGNVAIIALNRPEKRNAINDEMLDGLLDAIAMVGRTEAIAAAVLIGRGPAFSAGGDITAMDAMDATSFRATIDRYMRVSSAFRTCPKPVVAAVHGYALAGGFELALICDVRFAATGTRFGLPDTPLGLSPTSGMTWLLPRVIGLGRAMDLALSGRDIDAAEAERIGLVSRVVEPDALVDEATAYAGLIASHPRVGVAETKAGFHRALESDFETATMNEAAAESLCFESPGTRERMRAFVERKRA